MTGISTLGQALDQIERIKEQQSLFSTLSTQLTTGKKSQTFTGLGIDAMLSKRSRAEFNSFDQYIKNITNTDRRIKLMLSAIEEFKAQAENFADVLVNFSQESEHQKGDIIYYDDPLTPEIENTPVGMTSGDEGVDFATVREFAGNILSFFKDLVNAKDGDRYLLGGADTLTKPLEDSGTLDSAISVLVKSWKNGTITTDNLLADMRDRTATGGNPDALTDTVVGYSPALSAGTVGKVFVRVDDVSEIDFTVLGNDKAFRDIIVAASAVMNGDLPPMIDAYEPPNTYPGVPDHQGAPGNTVQEMKDNFFGLFNNLTAMVNNAIDDVDKLRFKLEGVRARIDDVKQSHVEQKNLLLNTIGDVEDVDINEVAVRIQQLQIQLDASYRVTAKLQELTLANYLLV
ncbi:MAG: flagellin [Alphaproteobacteria bacterium]